MANRSLVVAILMALTVSGVFAEAFELTPNLFLVTAKEGEEVELVCKSPSPAKRCLFMNPIGEPYSVYAGARYESGRITDLTVDELTCAIEIKGLRNVDNGQWVCTVSAIDPDSGDSITGNGYINVTVAIPPEEVLLRMDGNEVQGNSLTFRLSETEEPAEIECVALQTRPKPSFKWFIDSNPINAEFVDTQEEGGDGKVNYIQTFKYFPNAEHNGQSLRCEVDHMAYSEAQLENEENIVETQLDLFYKPRDQVKEQVFYGLKEGEPHTVTINVQANPQPTEGTWFMYDSEDNGVVFGAQSLDQKYTAEFIAASESNPGEYEAKLHIETLTPEMAGKSNKLVVQNTEGTTEYHFKLELGEKPPAEPMGSGPVVGIIVVVIILLLIVVILIVARSKGILCFARMNSKTDVETGAQDDVNEQSPRTESTDQPDNADEDETEPKTTKLSFGARLTSLFSSVQKTIAKKTKKEQTTESQAQLQESDEKKDGEKEDEDPDNKEIIYSDLDQSALSKNGSRPPSSVSITNDRTEYAEIKRS
ncbi:cell adhesion molecule 1-like isoform X2 [Tigriopus californicus]|uniref:cell adhesion molecule 1-like isoform X2 n=1 Tax=Tigriopus californicus TaxID=6832 RepID=UPI0027DA69BB|nr:cell adhesion molecule 1-like isoform X2 [Tigriopus californicus]